MTPLILFFGLCFFALCPRATAGKDSEPGLEQVVIAEINGAPITSQQLAQKRAGAMFQAKNSFYHAERKALEGLIDEYLLNSEAKRENVSVEQLLERHVNSKLPKDPSDEVMRVYYEGVETSEPYEAVRDKILEHLRQRRLEKSRTAYIQSLRSQAQIAIKLSVPKADIRLTDAHVRGNREAPVVLVEYADYECPYCQQIEPSLKKLESEYRGKVSLVFKDVPLPMHANAQKAAEGARCAGAQGKFWEYHDLLFSTNQYSGPELKQHARALDLDAVAFDKCLDSGEQAETVKSDLAEAQGLGLAGTPSFFINGRSLSGANYETLRRELEQELAALSTQRAANDKTITSK